jgi:hypothetical protein
MNKIHQIQHFLAHIDIKVSKREIVLRTILRQLELAPKSQEYVYVPSAWKATTNEIKASASKHLHRYV